MKKIINFIIKKIFLNWENPWYSKSLFHFSSLYIDFCYGDNNFDRNTNGEYRILKVLIPNMQTVFDIGANTGDYSFEIKNIKPEVIVHCFEPDSRAFSILKEKRWLIVNNIALGDKSGIQTFHLSNKSTHNSFLDMEENIVESQNVIVSTIDEYCQKNSITHIDFMKIDVEGWEYFVLQGGKNLFEKGSINYIQFEFSGASRQARTFLKDFIDFFDNYKYDLYRIKPLTIEKVIYSPAKERFTLTNYLAIKRSIIPLKELHVQKKDF